MYLHDSRGFRSSSGSGIRHPSAGITKLSGGTALQFLGLPWCTCRRQKGFLILGASWVVISRVIRPLIWVIIKVALLIIPLITTHEPPSIDDPIYAPACSRRCSNSHACRGAAYEDPCPVSPKLDFFKTPYQHGTRGSWYVSSCVLHTLNPDMSSENTAS